MGCGFSMFPSRSAAYKVKEEKQREPYAWETRSKLDPKDFTFCNLKGETKIKPPGSIAGQQFIIENCEDCTIYLMDRSAAVTVDDCKDCRIFVGPVESSIFIRDCTNCSVVVCCRQFRTRDCHNCNILLMCRSQPIIEASTKMGFGCFDFSYDDFSDHLKAAKMSKFHNFWSRIHDFTPAPNSWHFLSQDASTESLLGPLPKQVEDLRLPGPDPLAVPKTFGEREGADAAEEFIWALLPVGEMGCRALDLAREAAQAGAMLLRTNEVQLAQQPTATAELAAKAEWLNAPAPKNFPGAWVSLEFSAPNCIAKAEALARQAGAMISTSREAAAVVRYLGVDG